MRTTAYIWCANGSVIATINLAQINAMATLLLTVATLIFSTVLFIKRLNKKEKDEK